MLLANKRFTFLLKLTVLCLCLSTSLGKAQELSFSQKADSLKTFLVEKNSDSARVRQLIYIAYYSLLSSEFDSVKKYCNLLDSFSAVKNMPIGQANAYNLMAVMYTNQGHIALSTEYYLKALSLAIENENTGAQAKLYNNIASNFITLEEYDKAQEYATQVAQFYDQGDDILKGSYHANCCNIYLSLEQVDSAGIHCKNAVSIAKSIKDVDLQTTAGSNLADYYLKSGDLDSALLIAKENLRVAEQYQLETNVIMTQSLLAEIESKAGLHDSVEYRLKSVKARSEAIGYMRGVLGAKLRLANYYELKGLYKDALAYYKEYSLLGDSLDNEKVLQNMEVLELKLDVQQQKLAMQLLEEEKQQTEQVLAKNKRITYLLYAGILLVTFLMYQFYSNYQKQKDLAITLSGKEKEMHDLNENLQANNQFIKQIISIISHDLRSPFNNILAVMGLMKEESLNEEEKQAVIAGIEQQSERTLDLLNNLLQWAKSTESGNKINLQLIDLGQLMHSVCEFYIPIGKQKEINVVCNGLPAGTIVEVNGDKPMLETAFRNVIQNAIKFTPSGGHVNVEMNKVANEVVITVTDTGMGMSKEKIESLLNSSYTSGETGTSGELGSGLGIKLTQKFIKLNGGSLHISSTVGQGSSFRIKLPTIS